MSEPGPVIPPSPRKCGDEISEHLFRTAPEHYDFLQYREHLLEQYKLYVETVEANSDRRQTANGFFLTINTALLAFLGLVIGTNGDNGNRSTGLLSVLGLDVDNTDRGWPLVPVLAVAAAGLVICYIWRRLIASYSGLNGGKFKIVHALEARLPAAMFHAEWEAVGRGNDPKLYRPFTHVEPLIPLIFGTMYLTLGAWQVLVASGYI